MWQKACTGLRTVSVLRSRMTEVLFVVGVTLYVQG
jgi:hypothetical protein